MTRRSWILAVVLLAVPVLTGCVGNAQATAMGERATAEDRAAQWAQQPQLLQVVGLEGSFPQGFEAGADTSGAYWDRASEDEDPGDGRATIWAYRFISSQRPDQVHLVVVDQDGEIVHESTQPRDEEDQPLSAWEIDSDEAAEIAKEANDGIAQGTSADRYGIILVLDEDGDHENPTWFIAGGGGDRSGGGGGMVVIDAVTGEVLENRGGFYSDR